ncbi:hypothetical protein Bbelb_281390 [Branchiostoma belcheri]|nr:hypothetical protein Bbelb_281390 [Branchiostoma belcheri]
MQSEKPVEECAVCLQEMRRQKETEDRSDADMLHGCEFWNPTTSEMEKLERACEITSHVFGQELWKVTVKKAVTEEEERRWVQNVGEHTCCPRLYKTHETNMRPHRLWFVAKKNPQHRENLQRLIHMCTIPVNQTPRSCPTCGNAVSDLIEHFLTICPTFRNTRTDLMDNITDHLGTRVAADIHQQHEERFVEVVLGARATLTPYIASKISYKTLFVTGLVLYALGISLLPSMTSISGLEAMTTRKVSNQTAQSSDLMQNFTTGECSSTAYPQVMTEGYTQTAAEINATVERPLTGQCRLEGHKRETSQPPVSNALPWVWGPLLSVVLLMEQGRSFSFLASMVLVGNSGVQSNRGTINSIAQTMASLLKLLGPAVSANLFAWTSDNGLPWPLDHHLVFYVAAVLCLLMAVLCASLTASINNPRVALDSPTASGGSDGGKMREK